MSANAERRIVRASLRAEQYAATGKRVLTGRAASFNTTAKIANWHERIAPGAFRNALQRGADVRFLINHDPNLVLGRTTNGTLKLRESDAGLDFSVDLPDTTTAKDFYELVRRGDISECSFAFRVSGDDGEDWSDDLYDCEDEECCAPGTRGTPLRTLKNLDLFDCSAVTYPAYKQGTNVAGHTVEDLGAHASSVSPEARSHAAAIIAARSRRPMTDTERQRRIAELETSIREDRAALHRELAEVARDILDPSGDDEFESSVKRTKALAARLRRLENPSRHYRSFDAFWQDLPKLY